MAESMTPLLRGLYPRIEFPILWLKKIGAKKN